MSLSLLPFHMAFLIRFGNNLNKNSIFSDTAKSSLDQWQKYSIDLNHIFHKGLSHYIIHHWIFSLLISIISNLLSQVFEFANPYIQSTPYANVQTMKIVAQIIKTTSVILYNSSLFTPWCITGSIWITDADLHLVISGSQDPRRSFKVIFWQEFERVLVVSPFDSGSCWSGIFRKSIYVDLHSIFRCDMTSANEHLEYMSICNDFRFVKILLL